MSVTIAAERNQKKRYGNGFTLVEVLLAVFIFAIVVTLLFGSLNVIFAGTEHIRESIAVYGLGKNCLSRMTEDLKNIYVEMPETYKPPEFDSEPDPYRVVSGGGTENGFSRLQFASGAHVNFSREERAGVAEIVYDVEAQGEGAYVLKRSDRLLPANGEVDLRNAPVLCKRIKSLTFIFWDEEMNEYDYWDSESLEFKYATPQAIGIKLEIGSEERFYSFQTTVMLPLKREAKN